MDAIDDPRQPLKPGALPFGVWLAARGGGARASLALAALGAAGAVAAALAGRGRPWAAEVPALASMAIAWGAGVSFAFAASMRALLRDRDEGVLALARARGIGATRYTVGRVGGVTAVLALAVGGAVLVAGVAATASADATLPMARSSAAALAYAAAFAATLGPLAMAALGARSRARGYLTLLAALVLPELVAPWTGELLPSGWQECASIPAALEALRLGVARPDAAGGQAARAIVALATVIVASLVAVRAHVAGAGSEATGPQGRAR